MLKYTFYFFLKKISPNSSCESPAARQTIHMKWQDYFLRKNKKINRMLSAAVMTGALRGNSLHTGGNSLHTGDEVSRQQMSKIASLGDDSHKMSSSSFWENY